MFRFLAFVLACACAKLSVCSAEMVRFRLETVNEVGVPIDSVNIGDEFGVQVWVQDVRPDAQGVFSAYVDVVYDTPLVSLVEDSLTFGDDFTVSTRGDLSSAGVLDEVGAIATGNLAEPLPPPLGADEFLLFSARFTADSIGEVVFRSNVADVQPRHATTLHGFNGGVPIDETIFGQASVFVVPEPSSLYLIVMMLAVPIRSCRRRAPVPNLTSASR